MKKTEIHIYKVDRLFFVTLLKDDEEETHQFKDKRKLLRSLMKMLEFERSFLL